MKALVGVFSMLVFVLSSIRAATAPSVEIRFCPASAVHTYPLENRRELQSLLLQNMVVINHGATLFKIDIIDMELLQAGQVLDSKKLEGKAIEEFVKRGEKMQAAGVLQEVSFQFCGKDLLAPSIKLTGPILKRN
jgi:hypothetical protein